MSATRSKLAVCACIAAALSALVTAASAAASDTSRSKATKIIAHLVAVGSTIQPADVESIGLITAVDKGFCRNDGLDISFKQVDGSPLVVSAMASGSAQIGVANTQIAASADAQGAQIEGITADSWELPSEILAASSVSSLNDIGSEPVPTSSIGSTPEIYTAAYAQHVGVDPSQWQWVAAGTSTAMLQYLIAGKVSISWATVSNAVKTLATDPKLKVLVPASKLDSVDQGFGTVTLVEKSYAVSHPTVMDRLAECAIQGVRYLDGSEANFAAMARSLLPGQYTSAELKTVWDAMRPVYGVNGGMWPAQEQRAWSFWAKYVDPTDAKTIKSFNRVLNRTYAKWAVAQLGKVKRSPDAAGV